MRQFKGELITHLIIDRHDRYVEQKRLRSYLRGESRFRHKGKIYPTSPNPISSNPQDDLLPQIMI